MQEQDKRAVESMCRCGLALEDVINIFPRFPKEEIVAVYRAVRDSNIDTHGESNTSINCS